MVGVVGAAIAVIVGTLYGATAGYVGGRTDQIMMRTVDILMSIPYMFVLILLLVMFGRSMSMLFLGIGLISWLDMSRIVRGQTLSLKNREFIEAGARHRRVVLPHHHPPYRAEPAGRGGGLCDAAGAADDPDGKLHQLPWSGRAGTPDQLGALISEGAGTMNYGTLWQLAFPLFFFVITLFGFFFVGDGLRDALDPKER